MVETIESITVCSTDSDRRELTSKKPGLMPECLPPNISTSDVIQRLPINLGDEVADNVLNPIPDTILFDDTRLRETLKQVGAGDNLVRIDDLRKILRDGYVFTEVDLRERLFELDESS